MMAYGAGQWTARQAEAGFFGPSDHLEASADGNWGLGFPEKGKTPVGNASAEYLKQYHAWYAGNPDEKVIYLTFDAGYENGNTEPILDALKKHHAPAAFFLVGNYLETSPELVKRMVSEGHIVGNHTYHHPDMSKISSKEAFQKELSDLETLYEQTTGQKMKRYYRPPQENTVKAICRWQRIWDIRPFSGAWPMWTGMKTNSPRRKRPLKSF